MAAINYITVLNSVVSTEGSGGYMTNYIYYSLLVVYKDGSKSVLSVKDREMSIYLPFIRTPIDELQNLKAQMTDLQSKVDSLQSTVKSMRKEMNEQTDQKIKYFVDSLYPIPKLAGLPEEAALTALKDAGLNAVIIRHYDKSLGSGIVYSARRNEKLFKDVDLELVYPLPDVAGTMKSEAVALLEAGQFHVEIVETGSLEEGDNRVLKCEWKDPRKQTVTLHVAKRVPQVIGLDKDEAVRRLKEAGFNVFLQRVEGTQSQDNLISDYCLMEEPPLSVMLRYSSVDSVIPLQTVCSDQLADMMDAVKKHNVDSFLTPEEREDLIKELSFTANMFLVSGVRTKLKSMIAQSDKEYVKAYVKTFLELPDEQLKSSINLAVSKLKGEA